MRKSTIASIASLCMVPALFWSQDSSAVPAFARKYQTSCYTCHSGFPNRNAFGEAFKNNGYRWPGGEEEDHAKQEQTKMGADGWKQTFPQTPGLSADQSPCSQFGDGFYSITAFYYKRHKFTGKCIKAIPHIAPLLSASCMIEQRPVSIKPYWQRMKDKAYYVRECGLKDISMFSVTNIHPRKSKTAT